MLRCTRPSLERSRLDVSARIGGGMTGTPSIVRAVGAEYVLVILFSDLLGSDGLVGDVAGSTAESELEDLVPEVAGRRIRCWMVVDVGGVGQEDDLTPVFENLDVGVETWHCPVVAE